MPETVHSVSESLIGFVLVPSDMLVPYSSPLSIETYTVLVWVGYRILTIAYRSGLTLYGAHATGAYAK